MTKPYPLIIVGGVCGSGKSSLVDGLKAKGYHAHAVAQEHSYSPTMYKMTSPDYIINLECSMETIRKRRHVSWGEDLLNEQRKRLRDLRENANLVINTDIKDIDEVVEVASSGIEQFIKETKKARG
ncbi:deoxyadenosine/deoxycytidine kinase [Desulfitispora alkaliphila]|uniref:hypothetical protein n=1 Tax=Desulfitispora alkaliphila TaxID=622674 RepID=UPI003D23DBE4